MLEFIKKLAKDREKNIEAKYIYNLKNEKLQALFVLNGFLLDNRKYYCYKFEKNETNLQMQKVNDNKIKDKVRMIVNNIGKKNYANDYSIKEEFDSLMFIALVVSIEKEFEIEINLAQINIEKFDNIEKISKFVKENKNV